MRSRTPATASRDAMIDAASRDWAVSGMSIVSVEPVTPSVRTQRPGERVGVTDGDGCGVGLGAGVFEAFAGEPDVDGVSEALADGLGDADGAGVRLPSGVSDWLASRSPVAVAMPVPSAAAIRVRAASSIQAASTRRTPVTASRALAGPFAPTASTAIDWFGVVIRVSAAAEAVRAVAGTSSDRSAPPLSTSCSTFAAVIPPRTEMWSTKACRSGSLPGLHNGLRERA